MPRQKPKTPAVRGRPRGDRTENVHVRLSTPERSAWDLAATTEDLSCSDWIRRTLNRAAAEALDRIESRRGKRRAEPEGEPCDG